MCPVILGVRVKVIGHQIVLVDGDAVSLIRQRTSKACRILVFGIGIDLSVYPTKRIGCASETVESTFM